MTAKQAVREILDQLPDDCSLKEIKARIDLEDLLEEADLCEQRGEIHGQEEVEQMIASWKEK